MDFKTVLWKYRPKRNGTFDLKIYAYHNGQKRYFSTKLYISEKEWDERKEKVKTTHPFAAKYNSIIEAKKLEIEEHLLSGGILANFGTQNHQQPDLLSFFEMFIAECKKGMHNINGGTLKGYITTYRHLDNLFNQRPLPFQQIDMNFYRNFCTYLFNQKLAPPTVGKYIKNLKRVIAVAFEQKVHTNAIFKEKGFKTIRAAASNKIYLTETEISLLERLILDGKPQLAFERDRFLVAYNFLMRYSESTKLKESDFFVAEGRQFVKIERLKESNPSIIPVKASTWRILQNRNFSFKKSINQHANKHLKTIGAMAGISSVVSEGSTTGAKWEFITTHTARRSAATNLYLNGVSTKLIADLGGWKSIASLQVYLRASGMESAQIAKSLDFFQ